ncbi:MAG: 7-cyano-7-deazaguanine synthase QueC [Archangiaceae bacterium]|nr:7-cyano-7-deazaguanine synthase QueC [Archangiaceae bacterium]
MPLSGPLTRARSPAREDSISAAVARVRGVPADGDPTGRRADGEIRVRGDRGAGAERPDALPLSRDSRCGVFVRGLLLAQQRPGHDRVGDHRGGAARGDLRRAGHHRAVRRAAELRRLQRVPERRRRARHRHHDREHHHHHRLEVAERRGDGLQHHPALRPRRGHHPAGHHRERVRCAARLRPAHRARDARPAGAARAAVRARRRLHHGLQRLFARVRHLRRQTVKKKKKAVVLLSGGLDSATCLAIARAKFDPTCLCIDYGQRHRVELQRAENVARSMKVRDVRVVKLDLRAIGGSALTADIAVPKNRSSKKIGSTGIPVTYVPARNTVFLGLAIGLCEVIGATDVFIGVNAVDYSGYPDCRPEFIRSFEKTAQLGTKAGVQGAKLKVHAPLSGLSKAEIIRLGLKHGVDYAQTHSCYDPVNGAACGRCDSCVLRRKGFEEAGVKDPTRYAT